MKRRTVFGAVLASMAAISMGAAADERADIRACHAESDEARRLACYDRVTGAKSKQPAVPIAAASGAAAPQPPAAASPTAQRPEDSFGDAELRRRQEREAESSKPDRLDTLVAKVAELSKQPNGTYVVTLDNGQVWRQKAVEDFFRLSVGDEVRIKPAAMGSFLMANSNGRAARVQRIK